MTVHGRSNNAATIFDVAREAGVSYSTVSRVANGYPYVKNTTRQRVEAAMDKLGYVANLKARSLAGGRSRVLGLLVYELQSSYQVEIIRGIDAELSTLDYDMMLSTTHHRKQKESTYVRQLTQGLVDGLLIVLPGNLNAYVEDLKRRKVPFVLVDYVTDDVRYSAVNSTNRQGAFDATDYLAQLGHSRIGHISGPLEVGCAHERWIGYRDALAKHGLAYDEALTGTGDFHQSSGYLHGKRLLSLPLPPTAIFCSSDMMAFGAMRAIQEAGLRVPEDVSLIGFDDIPEASYFRPKLTTVHQPLNQMGRTGARLLVDLIENPGHTPAHLELPTELILRDSSATPRDSVLR